MSEEQKRPHFPQPAQAPISAETYYREQIEELKVILADREDHIQKADKVINRLNTELQGMTAKAKRRWKTVKRLEQCLQTANNKLAAKEESIARQGAMLIEFEKEIRDLKSTIDHLDAELDKCKETPNTSDSKMHIAATKTLQGMGYFYNGGVLWKPPLGQPPKHLLETDSATENATLAIIELEDVMQRRGLDNKACLEAVAHYFSARAKRRT